MVRLQGGVDGGAQQLDPTLIENRVMAADWGSIVKTNKH